MSGNWLNDEVEITITIRLIPSGDAWKSGLLQTTKHMRLPIRLLDYNKLNLFLLDVEQEIEHGLSTTKD